MHKQQISIQLLYWAKSQSSKQYLTKQLAPVKQILKIVLEQRLIHHF